MCIKLVILYNLYYFLKLNKFILKLKGTINSSCINNNDCDIKMGLKCELKKCVCNSSEYQFNNNTKTCGKYFYYIEIFKKIKLKYFNKIFFSFF